MRPMFNMIKMFQGPGDNSVFILRYSRAHVFYSSLIIPGSCFFAPQRDLYRACSSYSGQTCQANCNIEK